MSAWRYRVPTSGQAAYGTATGEIRIVESVDADFIVYVHVFTAGGWTSRAPRKRMAVGRFAEEAMAELPCPDESQRWRGAG